MVCLCVLFISHAQSIVIIDQNNLQPISGVKALLTSDNSSILGISDANGNLILPSKKDYGKLSISFEHTNYHTKVLSFNEIKQNRGGYSVLRTFR